MKIAVFDIEANGFYDTVTQIFCISIKNLNTGKNKLYEPDNIREALDELREYDAIVGHNALGYDLPVLEKLCDFHYGGVVFDTLVLSKLRYPFFNSHSLESWGERLKFPKISYENFMYYEPEMGVYCMQDVEVTAKVFAHLRKQIDLNADYVQLEHEVQRLQTKAEIHGVQFDYDNAMKLVMKIDAEMQEIKDTIEPKLGYAYENKVHKLKANGDLSHHAIKLMDKLKEDFPDVLVSIYIGEESSTITVPTKITLDTKAILIEKLIELGWKPTMFTEKNNPQLARKGEVCENLLSMSGDMAQLGKYFLLKHRKGLLEGFFRHVRKDGKIPSEADTLGAITGRYTHRKIANLPAVRSLYGVEMRSLFGVPSGRVQVGCDLSGIEARMLAHYMDDSDYTNEILNGDIHTKNQLAAGLPTRDSAKTFFYGFLYGAGDEKVGLLVNGDKSDGRRIKEQFIESLPSLKRLIETKQKEAEKGYVTSLDGRPVRITKSENFKGALAYDTRKALNSLLQSSATIFFKKWAGFVDKLITERNIDAKIMILYHDELQADVHPDHVEAYKEALHDALALTDTYYDVKCKNDIEIKTGNNWGDCH
jgi:DNA polymerase-1